MTPTIAVVIPNRNDSRYIKICLGSILSQDVPPDQIIVVDDQSTDDSLEVIQKLLLDFANARIVVNPTCLGTMGALNEGLKYVTTDYVLFLSSNDYVEGEIFERAKHEIASVGLPGVWSAMVWVVDEQGNHLHLYPSPVVSCTDAYFSPKQCIRLAKTVGHWFTGTTLIYHRETLQKIGGFDIAYQGLGDLLAALTVASLKGAAFSPEPLGVMRQHEGGLMWRTITDLPSLDAILTKVESAGAQLSPALFTAEFCNVMTRRIRFTAIRALHQDIWLPHARLWQGSRYRLLRAASPLLGKFRKLQLAVAFVLLRPTFDSLAIIRYRLLGRLFVLSRLNGQKSKRRNGGIH